MRGRFVRRAVGAAAGLWAVVVAAQPRSHYDAALPNELALSRANLTTLWGAKLKLQRRETIHSVSVYEGKAARRTVE